MIYLDSSALLKLVRAEAHSHELVLWLTHRAQVPRVSSALAHVEVLRACRRIDRRLVERGRAVLGALDVVPVDDTVVDAAAELTDPTLRSLDAVHLASALLLGPALEAFVGYDGRLVSAAESAGLAVARPGL